MIRAAPEGGFDFGPKRHSRREVWNTILSGLGGPKSALHVALMPSIEGDEIEVVLRKGLRQEHLHVIDQNPAIVATLKRRYPFIRTYGVTVAEASRRMARHEVVLDGAYLDFSGKLDGVIESELADFCQASVLAPNAMLAVNVLRGREAHFGAIRRHGEIPKLMVDHTVPEWVKAMQALPVGDSGRLAVLYHIISGAALDWRANLTGPGERNFDLDWPVRPRWVHISRAGQYTSTAGTQTRLWGVFQVHRGPCGCRLCLGDMFRRCEDAATVMAPRSFHASITGPDRLRFRFDVVRRALERWECASLTDRMTGRVMVTMNEAGFLTVSGEVRWLFEGSP